MLNLPKHFFIGGKFHEDWRKVKEVANEKDPDDEELEKTPREVVKVLGFDPKEMKK
jgi:hypothetical protein